LDENLVVGLIGMGHWGPHYVRVFSQMPGVRVGCCCDIDLDRLQGISLTYPHIPVSTDPETIFRSAETDAVVIATPPTTHGELCKAALEAGKDVLVEKPIVLKAAEGEALIALAESNERLLMVNHTFLYNPGIRKMKELANDEASGQIYYMLATRTHLGLIREDVNVLWDLAPHDISIFSYVSGLQPVGVSAVGRSFLKEGREDVAFVTLFYPQGIIANIQVSWIDSNKERRVVIVGSNRRIVFDDLNNLERIRIFEKGVSVEKPVSDFGEYQLLLRDGEIISPKIDPSEPLRVMCQHFVECVRTRSKPLTDGEQGVAVVRVMEAIEKSLQLKGSYVAIEG
jgi:predicted dehydrogenase